MVVCSFKHFHVCFNSPINFTDFLESPFCVGNCSGHWGGEGGAVTMINKVPVVMKLHSRVSSHILVGNGSALQMYSIHLGLQHLALGIGYVRPHLRSSVLRRDPQAMGPGRASLLYFKDYSAKYKDGSSKAASQ